MWADARRDGRPVAHPAKVP